MSDLIRIKDRIRELERRRDIGDDDLELIELRHKNERYELEVDGWSVALARLDASHAGARHAGDYLEQHLRDVVNKTIAVTSKNFPKRELEEQEVRLDASHAGDDLEQHLRDVVDKTMAVRSKNFPKRELEEQEVQLREEQKAVWEKFPNLGSEPGKVHQGDLISSQSSIGNEYQRKESGDSAPDYNSDLVGEVLQAHPQLREHLAPLLQNDDTRKAVEAEFNILKRDEQSRQASTLDFLYTLGSVKEVNENAIDAIGLDSTLGASQAMAEEYQGKELGVSTPDHDVDLIGEVLQTHPQLREHLAPLLQNDDTRKAVEAEFNILKRDEQYRQASTLDFLNSLPDAAQASDNQECGNVSNPIPGYGDFCGRDGNTEGSGDITSGGGSVGEGGGDAGGGIGEGCDAGEGDGDAEGGDAEGGGIGEGGHVEDPLMDWTRLEKSKLNPTPDILDQRLTAMLAIYNTLKIEVGVAGYNINMEGFLAPIYRALKRQDLLNYLRSLEGRYILHHPGLAKDPDDLFTQLFENVHLNGFGRYFTAIILGNGAYGSITLYKVDLGTSSHAVFLAKHIRVWAAMTTVPKSVLGKLEGVPGCGISTLYMPENKIWEATGQRTRGKHFERILSPVVVDHREQGPPVGQPLKEAVSMELESPINTFRATIPMMVAMLHHKASILKNISSSPARDNGGHMFRNVDLEVEPEPIGHGGARNARICVLSPCREKNPWAEEMLSWR